MVNAAEVPLKIIFVDESSELLVRQAARETTHHLHFCNSASLSYFTEPFHLALNKMAWRNQGITGSNNIPLGSRRRFGGSDSTPPVDDGGYNPSQPSAGMADGGYKRGRSPERGTLKTHSSNASLI